MCFFKRGDLPSGVEFSTFVFRLTLTCGLYRGIWSLVRVAFHKRFYLLYYIFCLLDSRVTAPLARPRPRVKISSIRKWCPTSGRRCRTWMETPPSLVVSQSPTPARESAFHPHPAWPQGRLPGAYPLDPWTEVVSHFMVFLRHIFVISQKYNLSFCTSRHDDICIVSVSDRSSPISPSSSNSMNRHLNGRRKRWDILVAVKKVQFHSCKMIAV